jgi:hypothetical protein
MQSNQNPTWKTALTALTLAILSLTEATAAGKPSKGPADIPLCVTIQSQGALGSDGLGEYCNGQNGVKAVFTGDQGRFSFDVGNKRKAHVANLGPLAEGKYRIYFLTSRDQQDPNVNTSPDPGWNNLHLENLPEGSSAYIGLLFFIETSSSDTGDWVVGFGDYPLATQVNAWPCDNATAAVLTRVDANTWTLDAGLMEDHCLYHGYGNYLGRIAFPFTMTIRRK